jgi:hypothetical protein
MITWITFHNRGVCVFVCVCAFVCVRACVCVRVCVYIYTHMAFQPDVFSAVNIPQPQRLP